MLKLTFTDKNVGIKQKWCHKCCFFFQILKSHLTLSSKKPSKTNDIQMRCPLTKEEYIKEYQFDFIRQTDIKHKQNLEVWASIT